METPRARRDPSHWQDRDRSEKPEQRFRRGDREAVRAEQGAWNLPLERWRTELAESTRRRQCGRGRSGDRSVELERRLRRTVEHAASALVHVRTDEWSRWRHLQVYRWREHVDAAHQRVAERGNRQNRHRDRADESE